MPSTGACILVTACWSAGRPCAGLGTLLVLPASRHAGSASKRAASAGSDGWELTPPSGSRRSLPPVNLALRLLCDMPDRWPLQHHHLQCSHQRWRGGRPVDLALRLLCDMPDRWPLRHCHLQCSYQHWRGGRPVDWPCGSSVTCLIAGRCDAATCSAAISAGEEAGQWTWPCGSSATCLIAGR